MTERKYRSLAKYVFVVAKELGLGDMALTLHSSPPENPDAVAAFAGVRGRNSGHIYVSPEFDHYPPEEQRVVVVHELIHAHTERLRDYVRRTLGEHLAPAAYEVFMSGFTDADEYATDALATAVAKFMPLWEG